jgi:hypothetical protein
VTPHRDLSQRDEFQEHFSRQARYGDIKERRSTCERLEESQKIRFRVGRFGGGTRMVIMRFAVSLDIPTPTALTQNIDNDKPIYMRLDMEIMHW